MNEAASTRSRVERSFVVVVVAAAVAAAGLGAFRLGRQSLWLDELFTEHYASGSFGDVWHIATSSQLPAGVHHLMTYAWVHVFGDSEVALRSLSVVLGVACVVVLMLLARRMFDARVAVLTAAAFLLHAQTIHYFQEGRTYALAMLAATLATYAFVSALDDPGSTRKWARYGVVAGVACYGHLFVVFVIAAHAAAALSTRRPSPRAALAALTGFLVVASPLLVYATRGYPNIDWIPRTTGAAVRDAALTIVAGGGRALWLVPVAVVWGVGLLLARHDGRNRAAVVIVASWLAVPFALAIVVSWFKPVFVAYYLDVCIPAAALLMGLTIDAIARRSRIAAVLVAVAVFGYSSWQLVKWYDGTPAKDDYRSAVAYACAQLGSDGAVTYGRDLYVAAYYAPATCVDSPLPRRWLLVVRSTDPRPDDRDVVITHVESFNGVDVLTLARR